MQAANIVHAAGESSPGNLPSGTYAIVLSVPNELALRDVAAQLAKAGIACVHVREPDAPFDHQMMAIGVAPGRKEVLRRHLSSLRLLR